MRQDAHCIDVFLTTWMLIFDVSNQYKFEKSRLKLKIDSNWFRNWSVFCISMIFKMRIEFEKRYISLSKSRKTIQIVSLESIITKHQKMVY